MQDRPIPQYAEFTPASELISNTFRTSTTPEEYKAVKEEIIEMSRLGNIERNQFEIQTDALPSVRFVALYKLSTDEFIKVCEDEDELMRYIKNMDLTAFEWIHEKYAIVEFTGSNFIKI